MTTKHFESISKSTKEVEACASLLKRGQSASAFIDDFDVRDWVSSKVYNRGVEYFRNERVVSFEVDDEDNIHAEVEGSDLYDVDVSWERDGEPVVRCTCPYDWEPLCKHAVAAILFWQQGGASEIRADRSGCIEEPPPVPTHFDRDAHIKDIAEVEKRTRRSKKALEPLGILSKPKGEICGAYKISSGSRKVSYDVVVRDAGELSYTTCNCPDYLTNELSTCKHIELVKIHLAKVMKKRGGPRRRDCNIWISVMPKNSYENPMNPYEEIHIHASDPVVREALFSQNAGMAMNWNENGYLINPDDGACASENFADVLKTLKRSFKNNGATKIFVAPEVDSIVAGIDDGRAWRERIDKIIRSPHEFTEWTALKKTIPIKLYDYQEEGILFAVRNRRSFIGDDMGLGKTVQAISAALLIKQIKGKNRTLIFCPASLKHQWKREIEKISSEEALIVEGHRIVRRDIYRATRAMFVIVNYELIFRDEEFFQEFAPDTIILDEAQRIKNWETKTAKGIKRLQSEFAMVLTGTPFENKLVELQSLCEFLHPRALGPMWRLMPTYGSLDENARITGFSNLSALRSRIAPFFIRREKKEVLSQLPEKIVNEYTVEISSAQLAYHDDYANSVARLLSRAKKRPLTPDEIRKLFMFLTCMRIISNALAQHDWKRYQKTVDVPEPLTLSQIRGFHSPKLMEFRSVMEELLDRPDTKFVIFSQWERMLLLAEASIRDILMKKGLESVIFSGRLSTRKRPEVIERFTNDPKLRIFFSTDAGGLGLNLQESANYVVNLEMPWNPAVLDQRIGRVHRLGQKRTVNVINFISTGCIEERVYAAVGNKRMLFEGFFDGKTDNVVFEKSSTFIDKLREIMGDDAEIADADVNSDVGASANTGVLADEAKIEVVEDFSTDKDSLARAEAVVEGVNNGGDGDVGVGQTIDLTGVLNALGSWIGNKEMAMAPAGALKIGIEKSDGDVKIAIKKPPRELIQGLKQTLAGLAEMIENINADQNT
jgi:superfamily II DNA or RNA helicase